MVDPVATLIAARQAASTTGLTLSHQPLSDYNSEYLFISAATKADAAYIAACYDPALVPALEALQAQAAAFVRTRNMFERAVQRLVAHGLPIADLEGSE